MRFVKAKRGTEKIDASTVMLRTSDSPLLPNTSIIIFLLTDNLSSSYDSSVYNKDEREIASSLPSMKGNLPTEPPEIGQGVPTSEVDCKGNATCISGAVMDIVDVDTLDIIFFTTKVRIRLALVDTPEKGEPLCTGQSIHC